MTEYAQNEEIVLRAVFLTQESEAAAVSGTPTITIKHRWGGLTTTDVSAQNMTNLSGTEYIYKWHIPANADKTEYFVTYNASYADGTNVIGGQGFHVIPRKFYSKIGGAFVQKVFSGLNREEKQKLFIVLKEIINQLDSVKKTSTKDKGEALKKFDKITREIDALMKKDEVTPLVVKINQVREDIKNKKSKDYTPEIGELRNELDELASILIKSIPTEKLERIYLKK
jgi:hypothetical protein